MAANPADPFQGRGVNVNGNWYENDHPGVVAMRKAGTLPGEPAADPLPAPGGATPAPQTWTPRPEGARGPELGPPNIPPVVPAPAPAAQPGDPFAAMGGGVRLPNGDWLPKDHPGAQAYLASQGGNAPGSDNPRGPELGPPKLPPPGLPPGVDGLAGQPAAAAAPTVASSYKDALIKALGDAQAPASLNDPALKAQSEAYHVAQTRGSQMQRAQSAEGLASRGLANSGAADSDYSGIRERQGEAEGSHDAGLVGDANKQKLQQLVATLGMMGNDINSAEGRSLQERIANIQAQIQRDSLKQQGSQFNTDADIRRSATANQFALGQGDLSLRGRLGDAQSNLGLLSLLTNNDQFGRSLSQNGALAGRQLDQQGLMSLLGLLG